MLFSKRLGMMVLGLSFCGTVSTAHAQVSWNPFAKKPLNTEVATGKSTTTSNSPLAGLSSGSRASNHQASVGGKITEGTLRLIMEESRYYPVDQRSRMIQQFSELNDAQARALLERIQVARINSASASRGTASVSLENSRPAVDQEVRRGAPAQPFGAPGRTRATSGYSAVGTQPSISPQPAASGLGRQNPWDVAERQYQQQTKKAGTTGSSFQQPVGSTRMSGTASTQNPFAANARTSADPANPFAARATVTRQAADNPFAQAAANQPAGQKMIIQPAGLQETSEAAKYVNYYRPVSSESTGRETVERAIQTTPEPLANTPAVGRSADLEGLIARAESDVVRLVPGTGEADHQVYITKHVELRLLYLLSGQRDRALTAIPGIPAEEQTFWNRVFWGLAGYLDAERYPDRTARTTSTLEQLRTAIQSLQGQANLSVRQAAFCTDIQSFGDFTKFEREEFSPGQEVLVYSELDNFKSERTPEGQFRTVLKSAIRIVPHGTQDAIDEVQYNTTEDLCRSYRQDFMQGFKYRLPQRISAGAYEMVLTVEDQLSGKSATYKLNFLVR